MLRTDHQSYKDYSSKLYCKSSMATIYHTQWFQYLKMVFLEIPNVTIHDQSVFQIQVTYVYVYVYTYAVSFNGYPFKDTA